MYAYARTRTISKQAKVATTAATRQPLRTRVQTATAPAPAFRAPAPPFRTRPQAAAAPAPPVRGPAPPFRTRTQAASAPAPPYRTRTRSAPTASSPGPAALRTRAQQVTSASRTLSAGSVGRTGVTLHRVRLGPKVLKIRIGKSGGVQIGDRNRQLNNYRYKLVRPRVSLDHLFKGHPARLRSFARLVANPRSAAANSAFRRQLSAGPTRPSRVRFADPARTSVRITARVDEYGALVVDKSRGVQVGDDSTQRNNFNYRMVGEEISLERVLHDRPDLARALALTVRYPGNTAVQRSFTRQLSNEYVRGSKPSLSTLSQDWLGSSLAVERAAGLQLGGGNRRTDRVNIKIGRFVMRGWESSVNRMAAEIGEPASMQQPIETWNLLNRVSADLDITRMEPSARDRVDHLDDRDEPGAIGPAIGI